MSADARTRARARTCVRVVSYRGNSRAVVAHRPVGHGARATAGVEEADALGRERDARKQLLEHGVPLRAAEVVVARDGVQIGRSGCGAATHTRTEHVQCERKYVARASAHQPASKWYRERWVAA